MFTEEILDDMFTFHSPDPDSLQRFEKINAAAKAFAIVIVAETPQCADQTTAIRLVRIARMWANSAIAYEGRY